MKRASKPNWIKQIALTRIEKLFQMAEENCKAHPDRSKRYVALARKLSTRYTVPVPSELKRKFCKKCGVYWTLGKNLKVRANPKTKSVEYLCTECRVKKRYGYSKKKKRKAVGD